MTTEIMIVTEQHEYESAGFEFTREMRLSSKEFENWFELDHVFKTWIGGTSHVRRQNDNARGFIMNLGPKLLRMSYWIEESQKDVGPTTDFIAPGQLKEIGAAKGVIWSIHEAQS